jgi:small subunit ribosomal protein S1
MNEQTSTESTPSSPEIPEAAIEQEEQVDDDVDAPVDDEAAVDVEAGVDDEAAVDAEAAVDPGISGTDDGPAVETLRETMTSHVTLSDVGMAGGGLSIEDLEMGEYADDEYDDMLAMYDDTLSDIVEGEIVKAKVLRKTDTAVILDVGFKSEGAVPLDEFRDPDELQPGDEVEVFLESLEDQEGVVVLSKKKADFLRVWEKIKSAYDNDETVPGALKRKIKGGVTVDLMGVDAFLPGSQIALRRVPNVEDLIGNEYEFKILKLNKRRRNIVVSRRVILEEDRAEKREELKEELEVGQVRKGVVKNITDFGAFIDLGGMDGLLHITDMSWGRIGHPSEVTSIGDEVEVKILDIDWDRERISLGLKQLEAYPWEDVAEKYPVGSRVKGRVVSITNYGAFIELEKGVEGLVHISEMSWTRNVRHPSQLLSINEEVECVVLRVDEEDKKISLGMKQTEEDPWLALPAKYPQGTRITGVVRNLTSFGAFVEVEPGIDGLVHISDMSWTRRVQHPSEIVRKGEEVEVVILNIDPEQKRISLGLKQTEEDPWYELAKKYEPDTEVSGSVVRLLDKGVVVDLGDDVEGFVPISQLGVEEELEDPAMKFVEGDELDLKVLESDPINRRIVLSVTELSDEIRDRPLGSVQRAVEPDVADDEAAGADEGVDAPAAEADVEVEAEVADEGVDAAAAEAESDDDGGEDDDDDDVEEDEEDQEEEEEESS